jgi:hypothetical protein
MMDGHILWALLRISSAAEQDLRGDGKNCTMPSSAFRFDAIDRSGVFAGIQPYGPVELLNGRHLKIGHVSWKLSGGEREKDHDSGYSG